MSEKQCCHKKTERDEANRKKLINRLNRLEGQIRGIKGMIEKDAYCADILIQSQAAASALNSFNRELLKSHISNCVVRDIKNGKDDTVEELLEVLEKLIK